MHIIMVSANLPNDPVAVAVWGTVLFILPVLGYAIWFVTEWRDR